MLMNPTRNIRYTRTLSNEISPQPQSNNPDNLREKASDAFFFGGNGLSNGRMKTVYFKLQD
jgi:hypothetical protein